MAQLPAQSLDGLKEATLPPPPAWAPQTAGWYVLFAIAAIGLVAALIRLFQYWRRNRYRSAALVELARIENQWTKDRSVLPLVPELVKRAALQAAPRKDIAALSGQSWLQFLDNSYGGTGFSRGPGQLLLKLAYAPASVNAQIGADQVRDLFALVALWIRKHHARV